MSRDVSITLQNTQEGAAITEAILADNEGAIRRDFPAMIKIDCAGRLVIRASSVSERLGREWDPQEVHLSLISLSGSIDEDDDSLTLFWR
jgi:phenol hydroxylase P2 protein